MWAWAKSAVSRRKTELRYAASGAAIGSVFFGCNFLLDMQIREWRQIDASASTTFTATTTHALALLLPLAFARIFYAMGRRHRDMAERVRQMAETEAMIRRQSHRDMVTGLYNRAHLMAILEEGIATGQWRERGALLFMLDLDDFKSINDTFGHRVGDLVLEAVGRRLTAVSGPDDIAVRLGGDEFVVVHFPSMDETMPELFAEAILAEITQELALDETLITPGTSIGVSRIGIDGTTWSDVMRAADVALYEAKREARNGYRVFDPKMKFVTDRQAELEADMRAGLLRREFELHYQPIYGAESGAIRSFEALVRWNHPRLGQIPPLEFIPLAESSGLIVRLGKQILEDACRTAASWPKPIGISVNLSPIQFKDVRLVDYVANALRESGLAPGRLDLEVTESLLLETSHTVRSTMDGVRALGVRITMDDFGTGFSSLSSLRNFHFDRLKIDRSFTKDVAENGDDAEIVRTIVRLSKALRMETILEGVETENQLRFARSEGLTEVQGFYCARPMTAADADQLLQDEGRRKTVRLVTSAA